MQQFHYDQMYGDVIDSKSQLQSQSQSHNLHNQHNNQRNNQHKNQHNNQHKEFNPSKYKLYNASVRNTCDRNNLTKQFNSNFSTHDELTMGRPTKGKKSEIYQSKQQAFFEPNHTHPNHQKHNANDPFHGSRSVGGSINGGIQRKMMSNQNVNKYQMDPRRTKQEMNPNAQYMFNGHNEQIKQNEFSKMSASQRIEPTYYDQTQYSGLETDRMFSAETKDISDQYSNAASDPSSEISNKYNRHVQEIQQNQSNRNPILPLSDESSQYKQKRSFRSPYDEVDNNNKLWEYQFTPMTTPQ